MAVCVGFIFAGVGVLTAIITIIRKLVVANIQVGWSSLMAVNLLIGGVILIFMGLIGEYIGRIYMCINETPQYVIKDIVKSEDKKERP